MYRIFYVLSRIVTGLLGSYMKTVAPKIFQTFESGRCVQIFQIYGRIRLFGGTAFRASIADRYDYGNRIRRFSTRYHFYRKISTSHALLSPYFNSASCILHCTAIQAFYENGSLLLPRTLYPHNCRLDRRKRKRGHLQIRPAIIGYYIHVHSLPSCKCNK